MFVVASFSIRILSVLSPFSPNKYTRNSRIFLLLMMTSNWLSRGVAYNSLQSSSSCINKKTVTAKLNCGSIVYVVGGVGGNCSSQGNGTRSRPLRGRVSRPCPSQASISFNIVKLLMIILISNDKFSCSKAHQIVQPRNFSVHHTHIVHSRNQNFFS